MENKIIDYINKNKFNEKSIEFISRNFANDENLKPEDVVRDINSLNMQGKILFLGEKNIATIEYLGLIEGVVSGNSKGFAFVEPIDSNLPNLFIPPNKINSALHGDIVLVQKKDGGKQSDEGEIKYIITRYSKKIVGTFKKSKNFGFVIPDNKRISKDIYIKKNDSLNAEDDHKVIVEITDYETGKSLTGKIIEILGFKNSPEVELLSIIRDHDIYDFFNDDIELELKSIPKSVCEKDKKNRVDLRNKKIFTIDGKDAKDLDDAISIEFDDESKTYTLGVHIADVAQYVKKNSNIDNEAFKRGTSVYMAHTVVPMLPAELSNGICSLHPRTDRLTLSVIMKIDEHGSVIDTDVFESVINSIERLNYDDINAFYEGDDDINLKYKNISLELQMMKKLHYILEKSRKKRGALDFDIPETKVIIDHSSYEVKEIKVIDRKDSHRLIESFMIKANEVIADKFFKNKIPFMYRIHEHPSEDNFDDLKEYMARFGFHINKNYDSITHKDFQSLTNQIKNTDYKYSLSKIILRSMQKAKYSSRCIGHFGLASKFYTHFTSPIRRYPDLVVHRIIKDYLRNKINEQNSKKLKRYIDSAAHNSSIREINAEKCERDVDDYFKAVYMKDKIGEIYEGIISGVISSGIFVEVLIGIEGFVPITNLSEKQLQYDEKRLQLSNSHESFSIGDKVKIKVEKSIPAERRIDFIICENDK